MHETAGKNTGNQFPEGKTAAHLVDFVVAVHVRHTDIGCLPEQHLGDLQESSTLISGQLRLIS